MRGQQPAGEEPEAPLYLRHNNNDDQEPEPAEVKGHIEMQAQNAQEANSSSMGNPPKRKPSAQFWYIFFAGSCVISLLVDPLFFYIPVINEVEKCVDFDRSLYIVTVCLRTLLDCISLVDIILPFLRSSLDKEKETKGDTSHVSLRRNRYLKVANDIVAILPIPQVLFLIIFSKMRGSKSLNKRKVLSGVLVVQYVPRALRVYLSCSKVFIHKIINLSKSLIAVKAGFNLFLFIIAGHILGGFWYFLSIERETACWHLACESHSDKCVPSSFACNHGSFGNYTFLNDSCPIQTPNATVFDFGIFQGALQCGIVASMDFPRKILYCFWWGLRNLSSFGSNLETSTDFWENGFAVLTSISGLVLFMCFLGHLQVPLLQNESEDGLELISSDFLKQVYYNENSYIAREGEPLDALLFITQGILWTCTTSPDNRQIGFITTDEFYGVELLEWMFKSPSLLDPSNLPFSTRISDAIQKSKVSLLRSATYSVCYIKYWWKFSKLRGKSDSNLVQSFAASNVQATFYRWRYARQVASRLAEDSTT